MCFGLSESKEWEEVTQRIYFMNYQGTLFLLQEMNLSNGSDDAPYRLSEICRER
jgi:hypothetical protein